MKLRQYLSGRVGARNAFTMIEIAISIAVVAFAMVAIMGVLPTGMTVERDNQEDTLINQEGQYWLEAIRGGARGLTDLTNYVESITITNYNFGAANPYVGLTNGSGPGGVGIIPPDLMIGLLTTPKHFVDPNTRLRLDTNRVTAIVKAITGPAAEKGPLTNEFSFRYQVDVSVTPEESAFNANLGADPLFSRTLTDNLHDVRVVLRWPVFERAGGYAVGSNRKTFRAKVSGLYQADTNQVTLGGKRYSGFFIKPNLYAHALR